MNQENNEFNNQPINNQPINNQPVNDQQMNNQTVYNQPINNEQPVQPTIASNVPKSSSKGLYIIGAIISLALIGGILYFVLFNPKKSDDTDKPKSTEEVKYHFEINAYDMAETITTYDIVVKDDINVKYTNKLTYPEKLDGPKPQEKGEYTIKDSYFVEPLKEVLKIWKKETGSDFEVDDICSIILSTLEESQNKNDDLCKIEGSWNCDMFEDTMDLNSDGKITIEECFSYYVNKLDPSIMNVEDNRNEKNSSNISDYKSKGLIPEKKPSTNTKRYKTSEKVNEIVLNGVTYEVGVDKLKKYLDNGFVFTKDQEPEITNSAQARGYFSNYPDALITIEYHTSDHRTNTKIEDCIVDYLDVTFDKGTEKSFYWKIKDFVVNEKTTKSEINNFFGLKENGSKSVRLYTDEFLVGLECGGIYETHEYSNSFTIDATPITERMDIPEWAE